MTRTEILELAKQAGGTAYTNRHYDGTAMAFGPDALERFAALVAAKEREGCANVCESMKTVSGDDDVERGFNAALKRASKVIRSRT